MSERREYRALYTVLRVDQAFLPLSKDAKLYWYTLKLELPSCGIGLVLPHAIAGLASLTIAEAEAAEAELTARGWVRRDGAVVWIINGLRHTPNLSPNDSKHRTYIRNQLSNLPRDNGLLADFRLYYAAWFDEQGEDADKALPKALPSASEGGREHKDKQGTGKTEASSSSASAPADAGAVPSAPALSPVLTLITACNQGMRDNPAIGESYNPIPGGHGGSFAAVEQLQASGVDLEFARSAIYAGAKAYAPSSRNRQVTTLKYFVASVLAAWEAHQADELAQRGDRPAQLPNVEPLPRGRRAREADAEAMEQFAKIRRLIVEHATPGNGTRRHIPRDAVRKLGARTDRAYDAIGGSERILNTRPEKIDFLIRDFTTAYNAAGDAGASPS